MSRIGKLPIPVPSGVEITVSGQDVSVKGPKGSLSRTFHDRVSVAVEDGTCVVSRQDDLRESKAMHGLSRALVEYNPELRPILKKAGFLTRDPRMRERKKYGQKGARARFQFSKR